MRGLAGRHTLLLSSGSHSNSLASPGSEHHLRKPAALHALFVAPSPSFSVAISAPTHALKSAFGHASCASEPTPNRPPSPICCPLLALCPPQTRPDHNRVASLAGWLATLALAPSLAPFARSLTHPSARTPAHRDQPAPLPPRPAVRRLTERRAVAEYEEDARWQLLRIPRYQKPTSRSGPPDSCRLACPLGVHLCLEQEPTPQHRLRSTTARPLLLFFLLWRAAIARNPSPPRLPCPQARTPIPRLRACAMGSPNPPRWPLPSPPRLSGI